MRILEGQAARNTVRKIVDRRRLRDAAVERTVQRIIRDVALRGDVALRRHATKLDGLGQTEPVRVSPDEIADAWKNVPSKLREALRVAARNIRRFAERQRPRAWRRRLNDATLGQVVRPLDAVGCYVPGGRYPLPSTLLMTVLPAQVAGVKRIAVVSPRPTSETLAAAALLGVTEFYRVGGAHSVAALAYGTKSIARVDKIVGPGNRYVTAAKKLVSFDCAIDMLAGPTEAVVFSNRGNPDFIAADLLAQAEHDIAAMSIFVTTRRTFALAVAKRLNVTAQSNPTARRALAANGFIFVARSATEAFDIVNEIAPEHLTVDSFVDVADVQNAGSIFVGDYSAQPMGDYCAGPNHVLPTNGSARFRGGLSVLDFVKIITVQNFSRAGVRRAAGTAIELAEAEGLRAHGEAVRLRCAANHGAGGK